MRLKIIMPLLTFVLAVLALGQVSAQETGTPVTLAAAAGPSMSILSQIRKYSSPMVVQIGCRYDCESCRQSCYGRMRVGCNTSECRKAFSRCMKGCWTNICKRC